MGRRVGVGAGWHRFLCGPGGLWVRIVAASIYQALTIYQAPF